MESDFLPQEPCFLEGRFPDPETRPQEDLLSLHLDVAWQGRWGWGVVRRGPLGSGLWLPLGLAPFLHRTPGRF